MNVSSAPKYTYIEESWYLNSVSIVTPNMLEVIKGFTIQKMKVILRTNGGWTQSVPSAAMFVVRTIDGSDELLEPSEQNPSSHMTLGYR